MDWTDDFSNIEEVAKIIITIRKIVFHRQTTTLENINSCGQWKRGVVDIKTNKCVGYPQMNIVVHKQKGERTIIEAVYKHYPQG